MDNQTKERIDYLVSLAQSCLSNAKHSCRQVDYINWRNQYLDAMRWLREFGIFAV